MWDRGREFESRLKLFFLISNSFYFNGQKFNWLHNVLTKNKTKKKSVRNRRINALRNVWNCKNVLFQKQFTWKKKWFIKGDKLFDFNLSEHGGRIRMNAFIHCWKFLSEWDVRQIKQTFLGSNPSVIFFTLPLFKRVKKEIPTQIGMNRRIVENRIKME